MTNELVFTHKHVHVLLHEKNRIKILETERNKDHIWCSSSQPWLPFKEKKIQILHKLFHKVDMNFIVIPKPNTRNDFLNSSKSNLVIYKKNDVSHQLVIIPGMQV